MDPVEIPTEVLTATDSGDKSAEPEEMPVAPRADVHATADMPTSISMMSLIRAWQPMGFRIVVNLPWIGNDRNYMFFIRTHPWIPWLPSLLSDYAPAVYNVFRPILHDGLFGFVSSSTVPNPSVAVPTGITITQHSPPSYLGEMAWLYRKYRGSIKYRLNTVTNFAAQGYVFATHLRRVHIPIGQIDFNTNVGPVLRQDTTYNQGMYNAYVRSDCSMYRHIECVAPYEFVQSWRDQNTMVNMVSDLRSPVATRITGPEPVMENVVAVGVRGTVAASDTQNQIMFEVEWCAGDDFEMALPQLPSVKNVMSTRGAWTDSSVTAWQRAIADSVYSIPNSRWGTNGATTWTGT